jgi:2-amino-4-hydroxy-6-hydroxymethyldihydropteridine diphosphokinase
LEGSGGVEVVLVSSLIETEPEGAAGQPRFLNAAAIVRTRLDPQALLALCKAAERAMGRVDRGRWGPREADADIIFYGDRIIDTPELAIPHPLMHKRIFVLEPLCEIAPGWLHPVLKKTVRELLAVISPASI